MFQMKHNDADEGYVGLPGWHIWRAMEGLAMCEAPIHCRYNQVGDDLESKRLAESVGRRGNAHWSPYIENYQKTGKLGFCRNCNHEGCALNRAQLARILIIYQLCIRLTEHHDEMYVSDMGVELRDLELFEAYYVRKSPGSLRWGRIQRNFIPAFRDRSESVFASDIIDLARLRRPVRD